MYPSYLKAYNDGSLKKISEKMLKILESCQLCPHKCKVNRLKDKQGICKTGLLTKVYSFIPHFGEEPPISLTKGSGTIFFSNCNLRCAYCQNYKFSQEGGGKVAGYQELSDIMIKLQEKQAHNINLVTPTHVIPQILNSLLLAIEKGLRIPLVYNTSGYELTETIKLLSGIVDIYLPDMRYAQNNMALKYSSALNYPKYNQSAVLEMYKQVGIPQIDENGLIKKGLIIRHLVLPNNISGTNRIMKFIASKISIDAYISLMSQYSPYYKAAQFRAISRRITKNEYKAAQKTMEKYGLYNGWTQSYFGLEKLAGINIKPVF